VAVPDQAAVLGVDNDETVCEVCDPPLSSVAANHARVGYEAAELLDGLMQGRRAPKRPVYVEPTGVVARRSTDAMAIADSDIAAALRFIRENACQPIHVSDVVEHVAISHTALKERFRQWVGRTVHEEITRARMDEAKRLLAATDLSLRQIAHRLGYRQQEYLGVVFKQYTGKTPAQFREEAQL
jgi:LacI family transcriptional regulator